MGSYGGKEHAFKNGYEILIYQPSAQLAQIPTRVEPSQPELEDWVVVQPQMPGRDRLTRPPPSLEYLRRISAHRAPARPPPPVRGIPHHENDSVVLDSSNGRNSATSVTETNRSLLGNAPSEVQIEQSNPEGIYTCQICFEKFDGNWGFVHGGTMHAGYCQGCVLKLKQDGSPCPQCRCDIEAVIKVFMN